MNTSHEKTYYDDYKEGEKKSSDELLALYKSWSFAGPFSPACYSDESIELLFNFLKKTFRKLFKS
jgi:hypothetical protein